MRILRNDLNAAEVAARQQHTTQTKDYAQNISDSISNAVIAINNGLSEGQSSAQAARIIAKSPEIDAAAILNCLFFGS